MTRHLLVRWPDRRRPPPGTLGRYELVPPRTYAYVHDEGAFYDFVFTHFQAEGIADCGDHVRDGFRRRLLDEVEERGSYRGVALPAWTGVKAHTEGVHKIRVWPAVLHAGDRPGAFLWESPVLVGRSDQRKTRSQRRARWRTGSARAAAGCARGAGSTRRSRPAPGKSGGGRRRRSAGR